MIKKIFTLLYLSFVFLLYTSSLSFANTGERKCSYEQAVIYFENPTPVLNKYSTDYYCSDILYLMNNNYDNIPLSEYKNLYGEVSSNYNYLRSIGITPDIVNNHFLNPEDGIDEEDQAEMIEFLNSQSNIDSFLISTTPMIQTGADFIITSEDSETEKYPGSILNEKEDDCIKDKAKNYTTPNAIYGSGMPSYFEVFNAIPIARRPIAIHGNILTNVFGETVGSISYETSLGGDILSRKSSIRKIEFSDKIFSRNISTVVDWNEKVCKTETLESMVAKSSVCFLCPYIVIIFNTISHLFDWLYNSDTFRYTIITFLVLFGCFYFLTTFLKGFKNAPFEIELDNYYKDIAEKLRLIFITVTILLLPPRILFSFTMEPIMDLSLGVSSRILSTAGNPNSCDSRTIVDSINAKRIETREENIVPPVVKTREANADAQLQDSYIISKETMGSIICFLSNTLTHNGKQMMMGKVLMQSIFSNNDNKVLNFVIGLIIWGLFFIINFMISFYILDALIDILKIGITWPFMIFGYAFNWIGFNVTSIIDTAKSFAFTLITLAVFSLFNTAMLHSFYFNSESGGDNLLGILDRAIASNNAQLIIGAIPTDIIGVSKFIFIVYAMYYVYSQLSTFAKSYGGSIGDRPIGKALQKTFDSLLKIRVNREASGTTKKKDKTTTTKTKETTETTEVKSE